MTTMPKAAETVLEINLNNLEQNYLYLKTLLKPETKFLGVVKAFGYGSDSVKIAQKLVVLGVDYFAVAYAKEGAQLREGGIKTPILVLHPQAVNFDTLIAHELEPSLYSPKILKEFIAVATQKGLQDYPVHIKFNTGLNRLGFWENDVDFVSEQLNGREEIKIVSIFSHLAASEDKSEEKFTRKQIESFLEIVKQIEGKLDYRVMKHLLNTSGILNYAEEQYDMVRSGIGIYGFGNDARFDTKLKPVATLKTIISQIHKIEPGETVGYNRAFKSDTYRMTATLPIGHADGIGRQYGNGQTYVVVNGQKAPIIGNVCMDMVMIDITGLDCNEGDEVIIFGATPTAAEVASKAKTISYELLTAISQRVKRTFIDS
jgi:alanine racemase